MIDLICVTVGPAIGIAVGCAAWEWLAYLPSAVVLFALVPLAASLPARKGADRAAATLTSVTMLATFFAVGWLLSADNGSRERLARALPLLVPIYGLVALAGWWGARGLRVALTAAIRRAA